jgi:hypothetical protein
MMSPGLAGAATMVLDVGGEDSEGTADQAYGPVWMATCSATVDHPDRSA